MMPGPRTSGDYSERATEAAWRVLVDLGQVLASYRDCVVLVGGWVPEFVCSEAEEHDRHSGSIDVDLALDAQKLGDGRYAELLQATMFLAPRATASTSARAICPASSTNR
jgi:hypothetical protein